MKILLVENHADTLRWLTLYLEEMGHSVVPARTLAVARTELQNCGCDVLLSDIGLPDGTGWELLEQAPLKKPIFAIAMSGFGMNADNVRSRTAGYRHHLLKPFKTADLDKILEEAASLA
ncbi:MAG TPA: response regulator [Candidatus Saccharimonadales bacterium]|nr:response regulator [Candidatus Saccharimonadales bacterium]